MSLLIDAYIDRLALKNFSKHTLRAYASDLHQAEAALGAPLEATTDERLEAYASGLARELKPTSVRRKHASLRGFFLFARRHKVRTDDPTIGFEAPKLEDRLPVYLVDKQIHQLLGALRDETPADLREAAIISCLYYTGMRAGELVGLDVEHLDLAAHELRVFGKGKKERKLPVSDGLDAALVAWLAVHPSKTSALFVRLEPPYGRLGYDRVSEIVKGALARAGLGGRKFSCHKLRHTFATRLINRRVSIDKIQKLLGHRRIDTTTIYANTRIGSDLLDELNGAL